MPNRQSDGLRTGALFPRGARADEPVHIRATVDEAGLCNLLLRSARVGDERFSFLELLREFRGRRRGHVRLRQVPLRLHAVLSPVKALRMAQPQSAAASTQPSEPLLSLGLVICSRAGDENPRSVCPLSAPISVYLRLNALNV